jgi:GNAT superfamily N-acetyltransferase
VPARWETRGIDLLPKPLRRFAEEPDQFLPDQALPLHRVRASSFVLTLWPTQASISKIRTTDDELDETIEQARRLVTENSHTRATWTVGPSHRPVGLATRLGARGFVPALPPLEASLTAMALVTPPPTPPDGVEAKLVTNFDEYAIAFRIGHAAFAVPEEVAATQLAALPDMWTRYDGTNRFAHLAVIDGEPVGSSFTLAGTIGLVLNGSSVLPEARGRGAYRALVAARWARAVELEKPALVVQAGSMSAPILERCGFRQICVLDLLDDPAFAPPPGLTIRPLSRRWTQAGRAKPLRAERALPISDCERAMESQVSGSGIGDE